MAENSKMQMKKIVQNPPPRKFILPSSIHWQKVKNTFSKKKLFFLGGVGGGKDRRRGRESLTQTSH